MMSNETIDKIKMTYKRNLLTLLLFTLVLTACLRSGHSAGKVLEQQDSVITHARLLSMQREAGYTLVTVADPWKGGAARLGFAR